MSNLKNFLFTSESVSEGHPDKVSDRISDMVVDTYLSEDPYSRVACETLTTTNKVVLAGEVRGPEINNDKLISKVRDCIKDIGYDQEGFTWKEATKIESHLHSQSADIAMGVDSSGNKDEGAGDQGIMFGYACNETDVLMPAPIHYSHKILRLMAEDRKLGKLKSIEPDSKSQVTFEYVNGKPVKVKSVVISSQHSADVNQKEVLFTTVNQWFDESIFYENTIQTLYYPSINYKEFKNYNSKYFKKYKSYPNEITILTYDALGLIYYAWKKNGKITSINDFSFNSKISGKIFELIGPFFRSEEIIIANIKRAIPNVELKEINQIKKSMWNNYGRIFAEYMFIKNFRVGNLSSKIEIEGKNILNEIK